MIWTSPSPPLEPAGGALPGAGPDAASEGGESAVREKPRPAAEDAPATDDGTATGNP